ncbi:MAG: KTSC domain-containing protein [Bacteroidota bacterium]
MKKIIGYRKLLGVNENATLQELKLVYRNLMKNWHPDKFQDSTDDEKYLADAKSKHIIEAYHFLVSIAPETRALTAAEYTKTITTAAIADFEYKDEKLQVTFADGTSYDYFGVPKAIYVKLVNAPSPARFARRHIFGSFVYRSAKQAAEAA